MRRLVCFHLYNDFSGSPMVLKNVLKELLERGWNVELHTSSGGVLDQLSHPSLTIHHYRYTFSNNVLKTLLSYTCIQIFTFILSFRYLLDKDAIFYINTILPAGPALAGRIMGKTVVYHYHENAFCKSKCYRMLASLMQLLATRIICVSAYQASFLKRKDKVTVIPNTLQTDFLAQLTPSPKEAFLRATVMMSASLKGYKGVREFARFATMLPDYRFLLILNDNEENTATFQKEYRQENLTVFPRQRDMAKFYNQSTVVLNLSNPDEFIETFGMTALEAMAAGLPVIVPPVGGIAELVEDGKNGYKISIRQLNLIARRITELLSDKGLYIELAKGALESARKFNVNSQINSVINILQ